MRLSYFMACLIALFAGAPVLAEDIQKHGLRRVSPLERWTAQSLANFDPAWLHLKFVEGSNVVLNQDGVPRFAGLEGNAIVQLNQALAAAATIRRTFPGEREKFQEWKRLGEAASGQNGPDLSLWYDVEIAGGAAVLADTVNRLNSLAVVEIAHPAARCEPAAIVGATRILAKRPTAAAGTPDFTGLQDYLYETPIGLDAPSVWAEPGGRGAGMKFIDVELGWIFLHEDFAQDAQFYQGVNNSTNGNYRDHGTAVLGEVVGSNNGFGITGFASNAQWGTVGITIDEWPTVPHYFLEAAEALDPGDVWLIELQMFPAGRNATPMEWLQVNFDVIWTSSWSLNVVCVEAGANGGQDLDSPVWNGLFDRKIRDSGAIMVAAGTPIGRVAEGFSNYGSRMDVHAWGSSIATTGYGDLFNGGTPETEYTASFGGTSGASPMIVGSCLCLQGIQKQRTGSAMTPAILRQLLTDSGIAHVDPTREIGPRPDLAAALAMLPTESTVCAGDGILVEGTAETGTPLETCGSDDSYWSAHGESLFFQLADPVVQFELVATAPVNLGSEGIRVDIEASKSSNNANLSLRAALFNFDSENFVALPGVMPLTVTDTIQSFSLPNGSDPTDFIDPNNGDIRLLIQTIQISGLPNVHSRLDEVRFLFE